jgi:hypothetical protein
MNRRTKDPAKEADTPDAMEALGERGRTPLRYNREIELAELALHNPPSYGAPLHRDTAAQSLERGLHELSRNLAIEEAARRASRKG